MKTINTFSYTKFIFLIFFISLFSGQLIAEFNNGIDPIPDNCQNACVLELTPAPDCPIGGTTTDVFQFTSVGATNSPPMQGCVPNGGSAPDIWIAVPPTGSIREVTIQSDLQTIIINRWKGDCNNLAPVGCTNFGNWATYAIGTSNVYFFQISSNSINTFGNFTITVKNINTCIIPTPCATDFTFVANPPPVNDTYTNGTEVTFCLTVNSWDNSQGTNWFHSVIPNIGAGWDINTFSPILPVTTCAGASGDWGYYDSWVAQINGNTFGPGFAFEHTGQGSSPGNDPNNPGDNWGDACTNGNGLLGVPLEFCWQITASNNCDGSNTDLSMGASIYADFQTGDWTGVGCTNPESIASIPASLICCDAPTPTIVNSAESCNGQCNGSATANANISGSIDYIWYNENGDIIFSDLSNTSGESVVTELCTGNYYVSTFSASLGCGGISENFIIADIESNEVTINISDLQYICYTQAYEFDLTFYNVDIGNGNINWYIENPTSGTLIQNPSNVNLIDIYHSSQELWAIEENNDCPDLIQVPFDLLIGPEASYFELELCYSEAACVDLSIYDNELNSGTGYQVIWYDDHPDFGGNFLDNACADLIEISFSTNELFVVINDGVCDGIPYSVSFNLEEGPIANPYDITLCSNEASCVDLSIYDNEITGGTGSLVFWYDDDPYFGGVPLDNTCANLIDIPTNGLFVVVNDGICESTPTYIPVLIDSPPSIVSTFTISSCSNSSCYDLVQHNSQISPDPVTINWYNGNPDIDGVLIQNPSCIDLSSSNSVFALIDNNTICNSTIEVVVTDEFVTNENINISTSYASCGNGDGSATINLINIDSSNIVWNTGDSTTTITDLLPGNYTVNISSEEYENCSSDFSVTIEEDPACLVSISGYVFNDDEFENCDTATAIPLANYFVRLLPLDTFVQTDSMGYYNFDVPIGVYTIEVVPISPFGMVCPEGIVGTKTVVSIIYGEQNSDNNFFLKVNNNFDLSVQVFSGGAFSGGLQFYQFYYCNNGNESVSGQLSFTHDSLLTGFNIDVADASNYDEETNTATWKFSNFNTFDCRYITFFMEVPEGHVGTVIHNYAEVTPFEGDVNIYNNTYEWQQMIIANNSNGFVIQNENELAESIESKNRLNQNIPNPFINQTVIPIYLEKAQKGHLRITNLNGKVLKVIEQDFSQGYNEVQVNQSELGATGLIFYTLETAEFTATRKMLIIK